MMTKNQIMAKVLVSNELATKSQVQEYWDRIDSTHDLGMLLLKNGILDRQTYEAVNAYVSDLEVKLNAAEKAKAADSFERPAPKPKTAQPAKSENPVPEKQPAPEQVPAIALEGNNPYGTANASSVQVEKVAGLEQTRISPTSFAPREENSPEAEREDALPDSFAVESGEGDIEIPKELSAENSLAQILAFARKLGATDVYLSENFPITFRIFGNMTPVNDAPFDATRLSGLLAEAKTGFADGYEPLTGVDFSKSCSLPGAGRSRLTVSWNKMVPSFAVRLISSEPIPFDKLYLPPFCGDFLSLSSGLVLIAGTSASGRSTTLGAFGEAISKNREVLVESIEKPMERLLQGGKGVLVQKEVGLHVHSGTEAVREAVLSGAQVILFDCLETPEELWTLLRASAAGALVFAVATGSDIFHLLSRLFAESGSREESLAKALSRELRGILAQRLIPVLDGQGWALAVEALKMTASTAELVRRRDLVQLSAAISKDGNNGVSLDDSLRNLVDAGFIRGEDAFRHALNKRRFAVSRSNG